MSEMQNAPGDGVRPESDGWDVTIISKDDPLPLFPEGRYIAQTLRCEHGDYLGKQRRAYVWFQILNNGPHFTTQLYMPINMSYSKFGRGTKLVKMLAIALGRPTRRNERLTLRPFANKIFEVEVKTANSTPAYSVIFRLIALDAGGGQ